MACIHIHIHTGGFSLRTATRVQSAVIPALLDLKQNLLMKSETGSGKTLAYLLPVLADLLAMDPPVHRAMGTFAIILAPTR
jgi:ATP-dependent RNA helicase DDX31/DBP7